MNILSYIDNLTMHSFKATMLSGMTHANVSTHKLMSQGHWRDGRMPANAPDGARSWVRLVSVNLVSAVREDGSWRMTRTMTG